MPDDAIRTGVRAPATETTNETRRARATLSAAGLRTPCVLVVDEDPAGLASLSRHLRQLGYDVRLAAGGAEALDSFREHGADVVITDLLMSGMSGTELIRRLREVRPDEPVIVFTGGRLPKGGACNRLAQQGIPLVSRPFDDDELQLALRRTLGTSEEFRLLWPGGF
jgi:CheY-like chemotaxis protein